MLARIEQAIEWRRINRAREAAVFREAKSCAGELSGCLKWV